MLCVTWFLRPLNKIDRREQRPFKLLPIPGNKEPALYNTIGQTKKGGTKR